jgi:SOS-response transcriptional repressor LexA/DNA-binding XRE family transcriptional regulator
MSIVKNIKSLCSDIGISIPKLETLLGLSRGSIYNWDKNSPSIDKLEKVAGYFKVPIDELVGWGTLFNLGRIIKEERETRGLSLDDLAHRLDLTPDSLLRIEEDSTPITSGLLEAISVAFDMSVQNFLIKYEMYEDAMDEYYRGQGDIKSFIDNNKVERMDSLNESHKFQIDMSIVEMVKIPIYGEIRAGYHSLAQQEIIGYEIVSKDNVADGDYFFLIVKGDSMIEEGIHEGMRVLVKKQRTCQHGKIGVVIVNGDEGTLKRVFYEDDNVILQASNRHIPPKIYSLDEVMIQGQVKQVIFDV